jgi:receptor protein-tyrosine kinase
MALSKAFGGLEKTLLVDADLRNPAVGKAMQLFSDHPGLTEFVAKKVKFSECVHKADDSQLSVLSSGSIPKDPMAYISKTRFSSILNSLATFYERLIVETSTLDSHNDALIISRYLDGMLLVVDIDDTDIDNLIDAIQKLRDGGTPLIGVVFNNVKDARVANARRKHSRGTLKRLLPLRNA